MIFQVSGPWLRFSPRRALLGLVASVAAASLTSAALAPTVDAATAFRTCANLAWQKPSVERQKALLATNDRWPEGEQDDPSFSLDFPFDVRVMSGSISYDVNTLGGSWTLSSRSFRLLRNSCPRPGGKSRMLVLRLRGWKAESASTVAGQGLTIRASRRPRLIQSVTFRGLGDRNGLSDRRVTLVPTSDEGCFISHIPVSKDEGYRAVQSPYLNCAEFSRFRAEYDESGDLSGEFAGFSCVSGLIVYGGVKVTCEDGLGRTMRFAYYYPTMFDDQAGPDDVTFSRTVGRPEGIAAASCGSATIPNGSRFQARNITAIGMSCTSARREVQRGGVGAHGYQRYGGWSCRESSGLRYRCGKGGRVFAFRIVPS